ncbi:hypothetical protein AK830_g9995 [Neonectria ditissima]|uniref:F-box domain-containing protein n=1 Tax=Neonectria ditissima TaxID=78410 RepID=A0A0P7B867_9HYPO|nr:hypothetical protein AK830_g9995 [Neonectria ditissima]
MPGLLGLPKELLADICSRLCPHCFQPVGFSCHLDKLKPLRRALLLNLMLSCKTMRDVARPFLYHSVAAQGLDTVSLLRTLAQTPELGFNIKEITTETSNPPRGQKLKLDDHSLKFLQGLIKRFSPGARRQSVIVFPRWHCEIKHAFPAILESVQFSLLACLTPNLESMEVSLHRDNELSFLPLGRLHRLEQLTLITQKGELSTSLSSANKIIREAPSLHTINGDGVHLERRLPIHRNVRTLCLKSSYFSRLDFKSIMRTFPKLESFTYNTGPVMDVFIKATPFQVGEALMIRRDTLRHFCGILAYSGFYDTLEAYDSMASLRRMKLESLTIDIESIIPPNSDLQFEYGTLFLDFLPRTIQEFCLYGVLASVYPDLLKLAVEAPTRFPNLHKVDFLRSYLQSEWTVLLEAGFNKANITCSFQQPSFIEKAVDGASR